MGPGPWLAQGISDAFRDAELLAGAVCEVMSGGQTFEAAMAGYGQTRNAESEALYKETLTLADFTQY